MDEELLVLEEQMASAQADVERLQTRLAEAESLVETRDAELAQLRHQLETSRNELSQTAASAAAEAETLRTAAAAAEERNREATQRYREVALAREPELPAEMVGGDSVQEIDAALERARQTVAQVRQSLESQAQALRVPSGAPARSAFEASDLTPVEKIRRGLQSQ